MGLVNGIIVFSGISRNHGVYSLGIYRMDVYRIALPTHYNTAMEEIS
ncbi:MAG: hypothetical protein RIR17_1848 [Planctomycetota bacterium]